MMFLVSSTCYEQQNCEFPETWRALIYCAVDLVPWRSSHCSFLPELWQDRSRWWSPGNKLQVLALSLLGVHIRSNFHRAVFTHTGLEAADDILYTGSVTCSSQCCSWITSKIRTLSLGKICLCFHELGERDLRRSHVDGAELVTQIRPKPSSVAKEKQLKPVW